MTVRLRVRVRPRAQRERIIGWHGDGSLRIEVKAPPADGRANAATARLVAAALGVAPGAVEVVQGRTSRSKVIEVTGVSEDDVTRRLGRTP